MFPLIRLNDDYFPRTEKEIKIALQSQPSLVSLSHSSQVYKRLGFRTGVSYNKMLYKLSIDYLRARLLAWQEIVRTTGFPRDTAMEVGQKGFDIFSRALPSSAFEDLDMPISLFRQTQHFDAVRDFFADLNLERDQTVKVDNAWVSDDVSVLDRHVRHGTGSFSDLILRDMP